MHIKKEINNQTTNLFGLSAVNKCNVDQFLR
jgi:hypothetical protein